MDSTAAIRRHIWDVDLKDWDYEPIITKSDEVDTFEVKLQPVPPEDLQEEILSNAMEVNQDINDTSGKSASNEKEEKPLLAQGQTQRIPILTSKKNWSDCPSS